MKKLILQNVSHGKRGTVLLQIVWKNLIRFLHFCSHCIATSWYSMFFGGIPANASVNTARRNFNRLNTQLRCLQFDFPNFGTKSVNRMRHEQPQNNNFQSVCVSIYPAGLVYAASFNANTHKPIGLSKAKDK